MYVKERRKIIIIRELGRENMVLSIFPRAGLLLCHQGARPDKVAARGTTTAAAAAVDVDVDDDATFDGGSVRIMYRI